MDALADESHLPVTAGHVHVLRIADDNDATFELVVMLLVVSVTPGDRVSFQWQVLQ